MEDLNINKMVKNLIFSKSIYDTSWNMFVSYKAEEAGRKYIEVNPAYTSQDCSSCGHRNHELSDVKIREFKCSKCDLQIHRDFNASLNILRLGLQSLGGNP